MCELCHVAEADSKHHLFPGRNNKPTAMLCQPCHDNLHRTWTNKQLAEYVNSIELIELEEEMCTWLRWRSKHPNATVGVRMSNGRKRRGRYA